MKQEPGQHPARLMAVFGSSGFTIVAATFGGFALGLWLDSRLGTGPLFMIALLLAGFAATLVNVYFNAQKKKGE